MHRVVLGQSSSDAESAYRVKHWAGDGQATVFPAQHETDHWLPAPKGEDGSVAVSPICSPATLTVAQRTVAATAHPTSRTGLFSPTSL